MFRLMGYQYRGNKPGWGEEPVQRDVSPCGTNAAYNRHHKYGEEPCQPCRDAHADYMRSIRPRRPPAPCGTPTAYRRHYARGEKPCPECVAANSEHKRQWRKKRNPHGLGMNRKKAA